MNVFLIILTTGSKFFYLLAQPNLNHTSELYQLVENKYGSDFNQYYQTDSI